MPQFSNKKVSRLLAVLMAAFLLVFPAQAAPRVRVYIPENALPLSLPQVPEAPALLRQGAAEDGAGFEIVFSAPVDSAVLLSGDTETAFDIYYDTYDIHSLPPLE